MITQRLKAAVAAGAILGVICILGASVRSGFEHGYVYLFAFWYNRVLMGMVIGLTGGKSEKPNIIRGAVLGFFVSFAFYSSTGFSDPVGFLAGIVYGIIIEYAAGRYSA